MASFSKIMHSATLLNLFSNGLRNMTKSQLFDELGLFLQEVVFATLRLTYTILGRWFIVMADVCTLNLFVHFCFSVGVSDQ